VTRDTVPARSGFWASIFSIEGVVLFAIGSICKSVYPHRTVHRTPIVGLHGTSYETIVVLLRGWCMVFVDRNYAVYSPVVNQDVRHGCAAWSAAWSPRRNEEDAFLLQGEDAKISAFLQVQFCCASFTS